jgi:methionyl-tRNA formyltransferase
VKLNIGYFADGPWSHLAFQKLIKDQDIEISFICVRFDTKDETLRNYCYDCSIDYLKHENINSKEFVECVSKYECNLFVSMSFNQIFKKEIINLPNLKTINCHAGKLPFYRGRNILNWALINDEKEFGITVHFVDEGIDTGDIILQETYPIKDNDDYSTLLKVAHVECANVLYSAINLIKSQSFSLIKQKDIDPVGLYCKKRKLGDEVLDWNQTSRQIFNFIRAICKPGPMSRSYVNGKEIKINKAEIVKDAPKYKSKAGLVLEKGDEGVYVKTCDSFVRLTEYEYDGNLRIGDRLESK